MFYFVDSTTLCIVFIACVITFGGLAIYAKSKKKVKEKSAKTVRAKVLKINPPDPNTMYIGGKYNEAIFETEQGERIKLPIKTDMTLIEGDSGNLTYNDGIFYSFTRV